MQKFNRWVLALAIGLVPAVLAGCDDSTGSDTALISLALTDEAGDVAAVWVEIDEIYLQGGGNEGRVTLLDQDQADALGQIELTELAGTTLDLVGEVEISAGNYGQLRFVIEGAVLETEGGEVFTFNAAHPDGTASTGDLNCPSCDQTGVKVQLPGDEANLASGSHLLVLDFDVFQSFGRAAGNSGMWVMAPVIRGAEVGFTGSIAGTVDVERDANQDPLVTIPECPAGTPRDLTSFVPTATAQTLVDDLGQPLMATTEVAVDGTFSLGFLSPDSYDLGFVADIDFDGATLTFEADAPGVVAVASGGSGDVAYTITAATCS
jgi:hypothetical protein